MKVDIWSSAEVSLIVADYFAMLAQELRNEPFSKTEHRRILSPLLNGRSDGSIEFKHQNISAVLVRMGLPYINGYKPRMNSQALLIDGVREYLEAHAGLLDAFAKSPLLAPEHLPAGASLVYSEVYEDRPDVVEAPIATGKPWLTRKGRHIDFVGRDAANRRLGRLGEEWVVALERARLVQAGREDLAPKVEWVSQSLGDGLGFDVLSYDGRSDAERLIEVKTTGLAKSFPFYVTANEVRCSEDVPEQYHLYRVFDVAKAPKLYVLQGALTSTCRLEPVSFLARA